MESRSQLLLAAGSVAELAETAIAAVVGGNIDPIQAHISVSRMEAAIKAYKGDDRVREITLREVEKYGKRATFGDCTLEVRETSGRYDFSECGCSRLADLYARREEIDAEIKALENSIKNLPPTGMADTETGEIIYPPARSSKTTIATTFKKR